MARERMVTRTIVSVEYSVLVVDMSTLKAETINVTIPSADTMTDKARDKAIKENIPTGKTFTAVMDSKKVEELYGMTEAEFMKMAKKLPPRTTAV